MKPEEPFINKTPKLTACGMPFDNTQKIRLQLPEKEMMEIRKIINEMADICNQPRLFKDNGEI